MRKRERVLSWMLATAVFLSGMTPVGAQPMSGAAAKDTESSPTFQAQEAFLSETAPDTRIKFEQTGFDSETGILTMSLKVKPSESDAVEASPGLFTGTFISDGYFAFQTDSESISPVMKNGQSIVSYGDFVGFVGAPDERNNTFLYSFSQGRGRQANAGISVNEALGCADNRFSEYETAYFVEIDGETLNCYLDFSLDWNRAWLMPEADGYVTVVDLYFQCYTATENGTQPAKSADALFINSIRVPQTVEEANAIASRLYSERGSASSASLVMGGAAYREKKGSILSNNRQKATAGSDWWYFETPKTTPFKSADNWSGALLDESNDTAAAPGYYYEHMDDRYVMQAFYMGITNTFTGDTYEAEDGTEKPVEDPDFLTPSGQSTKYQIARYAVPTEAESAEKEERGERIPARYNENQLDEGKMIRLRYTTSSGVSGNSLTTPEREDAERFFECISWDLLMPDGQTALKDCDYLFTGAQSEVECFTERGSETLLSKEAIFDGGYYDGYKFQRLYRTSSGKEEFVMAAPLGVIIDMDPETTVHYYGADAAGAVEEKEEQRPMPQLYVTNEAANPDSYLWKEAEDILTTGDLYLRATYINDEKGLSFTASSPDHIRLVKQSSQSTKADLDASSLRVTPEGEETTNGFAVGIPYREGASNKQDKIYMEGLPVLSSAYDQYGFPMDVRSEIVLEPKEGSVAAAIYAAAFSESPFLVEPKEDGAENEYTIIYKDNKDVKDVVPGVYELKIKGRDKNPEPVELLVVKKPDYLAYLDAVLYGGTVQGTSSDGVVTVDLSVPALDANTKALGQAELVTYLRELANQWRDPADPLEDLSIYDIVPDLRSDANPLNFDLNKIKQNSDISVEFEASFPENAPEYQKVGVDITSLEEGVIRFDSTTADGTVMMYTIRATLYPESSTPAVVEKTYRLQFHREASRLDHIIMKTPASVGVPDAAEGTRTYQLNAMPYDQYGDPWSWAAAEYTYGHLNPAPWTMTLTGSNLSGIRLTGDHSSVLEITSQATNTDIQLSANYVGVSAPQATVSVLRAEPVAKALIARYDRTLVAPPDKNAPDAQYLMTPTVEVRDQYNSLVAPADYNATWSFVNAPQADGLISLDKSSGIVTVKSCAPNAKFTVKVVISQKGIKRIERTFDLEVRRAGRQIDEAIVVEDSVEYPSRDQAAAGPIQLTAVGYSQYGDEPETITSGLSWMLYSVTLKDGTVLNYYDDASDPNRKPTGEITYNRTQNRYEINGFSLSIDGVLRFTQVADDNQVVQSFQTTATYNLKESPQKKITVEMPDVRPYDILVANDYIAGIQVPDSGKTNSLTVVSYVRSQYGLYLYEESSRIFLRFAGEQPQGVSINGNQVVVTSQALGGTADLEAVFVTDSGEEITEPIPIPLHRANATLASLRFNGIRDIENSETDPVLPIPSALSSGEYYTLRVQALDQFEVPLGAAVQWQISACTPGVNATVTNASTGRIMIQYSEEMKASGASITVRAAAVSDPGVFAEQVIRFEKAASVPAYAQVTESKIIRGDSYEGRPAIPERDTPSLQIQLKATVYSQYREEMPGEQAVIALESRNIRGASFAMTDAANSTGVLSVESNVSEFSVSVRAAPVNAPDGFDPDNSIWQTALSRGSGYPYELVLPVASPVFELPLWDSDPMANEPSGETWGDFEATGEVQDQYGTVFSGYYPLWTFSGIEGMEFDSSRMSVTGSTGASSTADPNQAYFRVSSTALGADTLTKTVEIPVGYNGTSTNEAFRKTLRVILKRDAASPAYLYFDGVDENGYINIDRPYEQAGTKEIKLMPTVYDQYGVPMEEETPVTLTFRKEALEEQGAVIEEVVAPSSDKEHAGEVTGYLIKNSEGVQVGELSLITGILKIESTFPYETVEVRASCPTLNVTKPAVVQIAAEERVPGSVEIVSAHDGPYYIGEDLDAETGTLQEPLNSVVYDQYGEVYTKADVRARWALLETDTTGKPVEGDSGNYLSYVEYTQEGAEKFPSESLISLSDTSSRTSLLTLRPQNYEEARAALVQVKLTKPTGASWGVSQMNLVEVKQPSRGGTGGYITLYYSAGDYGELVGKSEYGMTAGADITEVPGVKTLEGYGFLGWTIDGETLVNPAELSIWRSTVFTAVYKDITETRFLDGYENGTIRPNRKVTRAEFVKMLTEAMGGYDGEQDYGESFKDVKPGAWYANNVAFAKQAGILEGYEDGSFRPERSITRAEAAKMIALALKIPERPIRERAFPDVKPGAWYTDYITLLEQYSVVDGYEDGTYRPNRNISRAEAIKMIILITKNAPRGLELENLQNYGYCPFIDIKKNHWAYAYILRAAGIA